MVTINNDGVWNNEGVSVQVIIHPAFWQTLWFKILIVLIVVSMFFLTYKIRVRNIKIQNKKLEEEVKRRTIEIRQQNEEIKAQRDEITIQRDSIEKHREEITDSIKYAKRIQTAALPSDNYLIKNIPEHFVLFIPRYIVSGDFYWASKRANKIIITAADCTGHGVPGAFMSMLGVSFLNKIVNEEKIIDANIILDKLRDNIINALRQNEDDNSSSDGMDMALCVIDLETKKIQFAGAYNPLYLIKNKELEIIKADRMPVAIYDHLKPFSSKEIQLQTGDRIYMFSDGYVDQFGGPKNKKFMSKRFKQTLLENADLPMEKQKQILDNTIENWKGNELQIDDIVIVGIKL